MSACSTAGLSSRIYGLRYVSIFRNITAQCSQYELTPNDPVRRRLTAYEMLSRIRFVSTTSRQDVNGESAVCNENKTVIRTLESRTDSEGVDSGSSP